MERLITKKLLDWKNSKSRKPLILMGARQVGKTYIVQDFGANNYRNMVYINFDFEQSAKNIFDETKDPARILEQLALLSGEKIEPGETLIFFDEVQECPEALNSLKYFCEKAPEYHIVAAGSLLGVRLSKASFPVGKVEFLELYPMTFTEFLVADGQSNLVDFMSERTKKDWLNYDTFRSQLEEKLRTYFIVGGMPEAVNAWVKNRDIAEVNSIQDDILKAYERDFAKHVSAAEANKISLVWNSIPSQLARENKKFVYQAIKEGARAREYEGALNWLRDAGLIIKINDVTKPALPLKAYDDLTSFKIYLLDVGLLCRMSGITSSIIAEEDRLFTEAKGAMTENYCLTMLRQNNFEAIRYYTFDRYEVDFVAQYQNQIIPIETKSGFRGSHKSLTRYNETYLPKLAVRFSKNDLKQDGLILNVPLAMAEFVGELVGL